MPFKVAELSWCEIDLQELTGNSYFTAFQAEGTENPELWAALCQGVGEVLLGISGKISSKALSSALATSETATSYTG